MRPILSGTICFGLVSVYSTTDSKELRVHFLHKDDLSLGKKLARKAS